MTASCCSLPCSSPSLIVPGTTSLPEDLHLPSNLATLRIIISQLVRVHSFTLKIKQIVEYPALFNAGHLKTPHKFPRFTWLRLGLQGTLLPNLPNLWLLGAILGRSRAPVSP